MNDEDYTTETRRSLGTVGPAQIAVAIERSAKAVPFGKGEGRHGWFEPAHDIYKMTGEILLRQQDGSAIDPPSEGPVRSLLFSWSWTTNHLPDAPPARELWLQHWRELAIEHCDIADGRRYGVRILSPSGNDGDWRVVVVEGARWIDTRLVEATTCQELRQALRVAR